jgi:hypothetical protein
MKKLAIVLCTTTLVLLAVSAQAYVFFNEIHYDNTGSDQNEGIEIAGDAFTDLTGWSIVLYNGGSGTAYNTINLSGSIPSQQGGMGTVFFPISTIQNGAPDGMALVPPAGTETIPGTDYEGPLFYSYEGSFTATDGPANGLTSVDIVVSEFETPLGQSLQLAGTGNYYTDFVWQSPMDSTFGQVNTGQTFFEGNAVPIPGAVWLLGSGLVSLVGIRRKWKQ